MAIKYFLIVSLLAFAHCAFADTSNCTCNCTGKSIARGSFPPGFVFGAAGSAYQTEGAWNVSGKGPSNWDTFTHLYPEKIHDGSNGDVAIDGYGLYKEDTTIAGELGLDVYRFSISWSRILPKGQLSGGVNPDGIRYYKHLLYNLRKKGVEPCVTIFHFDVPQALDDLYGGFLSPRIVEDFRNYADVLFKHFGKQVKTWITLNEPMAFSEYAYDQGTEAPGRCTYWANPNCTGGDSATEPYLVAHHLLLAHAAVVDLYRKNYQAKDNGSIGITMASQWFLPYRAGNPDDLDAAQRALDFTYGWFMDPITFGRYPPIMQEKVGSRLPQFTDEESQKLIHSYDFIGLNYYTASFAHFFDESYDPPYVSYGTDSRVNLTGVDSDGNPAGKGPSDAAATWLQVYPVGVLEVLNYTKAVYGNPTILITENGVCTNNSLSQNESIHDDVRISYLEEHLCCLLEAIDDYHVNVSGYILWSLFDNFEWTAGYTARFGIYYVDFDNNLTRIAKDSAAWYKNIIAKSTLPSSPIYIREIPSINNWKTLPA